MDFKQTEQDLKAHTEWVRELSRSLIRDPHAADDVAQDAWVAALEHPPAKSGSLRAWLGTVTRNAARKFRRRERRLSHREKAVARNEALPSTSELVERAGRQRELVDLVVSLEEPYRTVLLLRYFEALPPKEIARRLGRPVTTIQTQLQRGLERLRRQLDQSYGDRQRWALALAPLSGAGSLGVGIGAVSAASVPVKALVVSGAASLVALAVWKTNALQEERADDPVVMQQSVHVPVDTVPPNIATLPLDDVRRPVPNSESGSETSPGRNGHEEALAARSSDDTRESSKVTPSVSERIRLVDMAGEPLAGIAIEAHTSRDIERRKGAAKKKAKSQAPAKKTPKRETKEPAWVGPLKKLLSGERAGKRPAGSSRSFVTGADGTFAWQGEVPPNAFFIPEKGLTVLGTGTDAEGSPLVIAGPTRHVLGTVTDQSGRPVEHAGIRVGESSAVWRHFTFELGAKVQMRSQSFRSDAEGRFLLRDTPLLEVVKLRLYHPDGEYALETYFDARDEQELTLVLPEPDPRPRLTGIVYGPDGRPFEGARVQFWRDRIRTGADGRFDITLHSRRPTMPLVATAEGFYPGIIERFGAQLDEKGSFEGAVLRLRAIEEGRTIRGHVVDQGGRPLAGAEVSLFDGTPLPDGDWVEPLALSGTPTNAIVTDEQGAFALHGLFERDYQLRVIRQDVLITQPIRAGAANVRIVFGGRQRELRGRVIDAGGQGLASIRVRVRAQTSNEHPYAFSVELRSVTTDDTGHFLVTAPETNVRLEISGQGIMTETRTVQDGATHFQELLATRLYRFRVELAATDPADSFRVLDAQGGEIFMTELRSDGQGRGSRIRRRNGVFEVCEVDGRATTLALYREGAELRRTPLNLGRDESGKVEVIRP